MHAEYEIFEVLPNGSSSRRALVSGLEFALLTLAGLAKNTPDECYAAEAQSRRIVAQMNVPSTRWKVFQVAYDDALGAARAELLTRRGYSVVSVTTNERAKQLLRFPHRYDLFIVGHAAPAETRREMVRWLHLNFPNVKILALNPPQQPLAEADFNVQECDAEDWLPFIKQW